jgi:diguanylate cyclase
MELSGAERWGRQLPISTRCGEPMTASADEYANTVPLAEATFRQLRASQLAATPRNYHVCYAYAARHIPSLNQTIDNTVMRNGVLRDADLEKISGKFISPNGISNRIEIVGFRLAGETAKAVSAIETAAEATSACSEQLESVNETLRKIKNRGNLVAVVAELIQSVGTMRAVSNSLQSQLNTTQSEICKLQKTLKTIRAENQSDPLTGLVNRNFFDRLLPKTLTQAAERNEPLCLVMSDIDHFMAFNEKWGYSTGDQVLHLVAKTLKEYFRGQGIVARYSGEEFAILLPKTLLRAACTGAERLRLAVMSKVVLDRTSGKDMGRVTLSLGIACAGPNDTAKSLIQRANVCLYAAKRNNRNRVVSESDLERAARDGQKVVA